MDTEERIKVVLNVSVDYIHLRDKSCSFPTVLAVV